MNPEPSMSHLFSLRLWREWREDAQPGIRVRVQHVLSGDTRYFREWCSAVAFLMEKLDEDDRLHFE